MALVVESLKNQLKTSLSAIECKPDDPDGALNAFCAAIADAVDAYIKTATVTVNPGIPVSTSGSPVAQTGATTGPGSGSLS